ncbi:MAG TPA: hypothetical protein PLL71_00910 [Agriterribacter sp.]|nr:hypothetical protein [Agriterribacter sp.]HRQ50311.1 hypothetical protein [Agriterribacter sp.]
MQTRVEFLRNLLLSITGCFIFSTKILVAQSIPSNQLILPPKICTLSFRWQGDSVHSVWEANAAILIPVKLKSCPRVFYMQFDLGAPYSLLYKNKLDAIQTKYPKSIPLQGANGKLENFSFKADRILITAKEIVVKQFDTSAVDWNNKNSVEIIGTIGSDLIDGKVAIIDYPHHKLTISQVIPEKLMQRISLSDCIYSHRSVLLPAKVSGKQTMLFFDTGSSMFELLTDKETCRQLAAPNAKLIQYTVKSWNKLLTANTLASNDSIEIANTFIPIRSATYIEGASDSQVEQMLKMGIGGMMGNKIFLNYILVLDTKNHKFGLTIPF